MKRQRLKKGKDTTENVELLDEKIKNNEEDFSVGTTLHTLEETQLIRQQK